MIMIGMVHGYENTSVLQTVKTAELTPAPSLAEMALPLPSALLHPSILVSPEQTDDECDGINQEKAIEKIPEANKTKDEDVLQSESSKTVAGELSKAVSNMEEVSKNGKGKWTVVAVCMVFVLCIAMWYMISKIFENESFSKGQTVVFPRGIQKNAETTSANMKTAVTLKERLALARKELEELTRAGDAGDAPMELIEDKRFGQDVEWMMASFGKLKISLRKVQIRELEKQMAVRQRARNLDVSKFSEEATADFRKRFKEYAATRRDWGFNDSDIRFSCELVRDLQKGQINPNVEVEDATYSEYSGPLLACILSGRIQKADEIAQELIKLGADPDVCLSRREMLLGAKAGSVVLTEGGIDRMEGFLLPLLGKPDFFDTMQRYVNFDSESFVAKLIYLKHDLKGKDNHGNTPLHVAAKIGATRLVALMLLEGVDVNATNVAGETPLHLALRHGHLQLEPLFTQRGADLALKTVKGESFEDCRKVGLFFQAIEKKDYPAVRKALGNGMSPDLFGGNGATILQMACKNNDKELVRILLAFNANVELTGEGYPVKHTPLALTFKEKNLEIFEMLLEKGADPNVNPPGFGGGLKLLPVLCERAYNDEDVQLKWLNALLKAKKPPLLFENWRLVIGYALSQRMNNDFISMLLDKYEGFPEQCNVIAMALFYGYPDTIVERIMAKKANVNAIFTIPKYSFPWKDGKSTKQPRGGQKTTALWLAVEMNRPKIASLLLKNGADVNWKDESGKTVKDLPCSDEIHQILQRLSIEENVSSHDKTEAGQKTADSEIETTAAWNGKDKVINLGGGVTMVFVPIPKGSFMMGSPLNELGRGADELQRRVTLTKPFWMGQCHVTQGQYETFMRENPSKHKEGGDYPVEYVSWDEAMAFCKKLTEQEKSAGRLPPGYEYTLPTEAQWEYSCRAGTTTALYNGVNLTDKKNCLKVDDIGWYRGNSGNETHPVGAKNKNAWGLYDMLGNVYEWCHDRYGIYMYPGEDVVDPVNVSYGSSRVVRGGTHHCYASCCRSAHRYFAKPEGRYSDIGFRVALVPVDSKVPLSASEMDKNETGAKTAENAATVNDVLVDGAEPGQWTHDWEAAVAAAKHDGKPVFVNFTGSDWCGWCKLLKRQVFSQPEWISWAGNHIYLVHVDFPNDKALVPEKYRVRNRELASRYNVHGYPACFLLDHDTLKPLGRFGASPNITANDFIRKVAAAMPDEKKGGAAQMQSHPAQQEEPQSVANVDSGFVVKDGVLIGLKDNDAVDVVVPQGARTVCIDGMVYGRMKILTIPEGVEEISRRSVGYYPGVTLETVRLPASVKKIGTTAFNGHWRHLRNIEIAAGSPYRMEQGCLVDTRDNSLVFALPNLERIVVPASVKTLGDYSFNANNAREIVIPEGVVKVGHGAFYECRGLELLSLSASVEEIGTSAFCYCGKLSRINVPSANPRYVARDGFLLDQRTGTLLRAYGSPVRVVIPKDVRIIGEDSFSFLDSLMSVTVPNSVRRIECRAFAECENLEKLDLPEQLDFYDSHLIPFCKKLKDIRLPAGLKTVEGNYSFAMCSSLRELVFPEGLLTIEGGKGAVFGCKQLERIFIPASVSKIGMGTFQRNPNLRAFDVHQDNQAFCSKDGVLFSKDMRRLVRCPESMDGVYKIPQTVQRIDDAAFSQCRHLTKIQIPATVTSIGQDAFKNCLALEIIEFENQSFELDDHVFGTSMHGETIRRSKTNLKKQ